MIVSSPPNQHIGAILGLVCACGILVGGFVSLRQEGIAPFDEPADIPTVNPSSKVPS